MTDDDVQELISGEVRRALVQFADDLADRVVMLVEERFKNKLATVQAQSIKALEAVNRHAGGDTAARYMQLAEQSVSSRITKVENAMLDLQAVVGINRKLGRTPIFE